MWVCVRGDRGVSACARVKLKGECSRKESLRPNLKWQFDVGLCAIESVYRVCVQ